MLNVDNKKVIKKLSVATYKANKVRNIVAITAIVLTTVMFTSIFTIGSSMIKFMQESTMRQVGGSDHAGFKYLSMDEYNKLKTHKLIKEISYSIILRSGENKELIKRYSEIRFTNDARTAAIYFAEPTTGLCQKKNMI